jgi:hypothetical protein
MAIFKILEDTRLYTDETLKVSRGSLGVGLHTFDIISRLGDNLVEISVFGNTKYIKLSDEAILTSDDVINAKSETVKKVTEKPKK